MVLKKSTKLKKRNNPEWLDKIFGKKTKSKDSTTIEVLDGVIFISGKKFKEIDSEIFQILEKDLKKVRIEFQPNDSKRKYILNREPDKEDILDEDEVRAKRRSSVLLRRGQL